MLLMNYSFPLKGKGIMTTWVWATLGGSTKPLSSPWCIIKIPIDLVVNPQLVCQTCFFSFFSSSNYILNIFAKFWPKLWEVAAWIALPFSGIHVSIVVVLNPPANFSDSVLIPLYTGTERSY